MGLLFSAPVAGDSLGQVTITPSGGSPIPISVTPEAGNVIGWINLPSTLQANTQYTINVNGITDMNGNPMAPTTSSFTTGSQFDFTQPSVASTVPANGASAVPVNTTLSVTFSKAMDPVLIDANHI
jgi:Bacterial Ig-like domain